MRSALIMVARDSFNRELSDFEFTIYMKSDNKAKPDMPIVVVGHQREDISSCPSFPLYCVAG